MDIKLDLSQMPVDQATTRVINTTSPSAELIKSPILLDTHGVK